MRVDESSDRGREFVSLSDATVVVYRQIMGREPEREDPAGPHAALHDVAHALANVAPIYGRKDDADDLKPLDTVDLLFGVFQRGGSMLRTSYAQYTGLSIRRADMYQGIAILRGAGVSFEPKK